jgi:histone H3/H4
MTGLSSDDIWLHCNICKQDIAFGSSYFVCSVSTCNRKRTGLIFCSVPCFQAHLPTARHRDAWAEQEKAPSRAEWLASQNEGDNNLPDNNLANTALPKPAAPQAAPSFRAAGPAAAGPAATAATRPDPEAALEVLVVVSKLKKYVRDWSGMNTSDTAVSVLSDHLRELCREATRQAGLDGRRTVLDRDFTKVLKQRREASR